MTLWCWTATAPSPWAHVLMDAYTKMEKVENTAVILAVAHTLGRVRTLPWMRCAA